MDIMHTNWLVIIIAALAGLVVGGIWYGPVTGRKRSPAIYTKESSLQPRNMLWIYSGALVFALLSSTMLAHFFFRLGQPPFHIVMMISTGMALGFIIPAIGVTYLFAGKNKALFFIDAGYWLLFYAAMGLVHGLWR